MANRKTRKTEVQTKKTFIVERPPEPTVESPPKPKYANVIFNWGSRGFRPKGMDSEVSLWTSELRPAVMTCGPEDSVVGFVALSDMFLESSASKLRCLVLHDLWIDERYQGYGHGTDLIDWVVRMVDMHDVAAWSTRRVHRKIVTGHEEAIFPAVFIHFRDKVKLAKNDDLFSKIGLNQLGSLNLWGKSCVPGLEIFTPSSSWSLLNADGSKFNA